MLAAGIIVMWSGNIGNIPAGWVLCDGNNGTPDLRDKFIVGAGDTYAVDATGGLSVHNHTFTSDTHNHTIGAGTSLEDGANRSNTTGDATPTGTTEAASNLPPYHALAFIMKT